MPKDDEGLVLYGHDLNGPAEDLWTETLNFKQAEKKTQWVENAEADGDVLVDETHYTNSFFELDIRVGPQEDMDTALGKLGELTDVMQRAEKYEEGIPFEWTPAGSSKTSTWHVLLAEYVEIPITVDGDLSGWFIDSPIVKVKLTCRPFGIRESKVVLEPVESAAVPQQVVYVKVGGDVPARGTVLVTDKATQKRRHLRIGQDLVDSEEGNPPTLITAASLVTEGFSGVSKTRSGAYASEKVIRAPAISNPITICGTGPVAHVGPFRVFGRVYAASADARFSLGYRIGDGPVLWLPWVEPTAAGFYSTLDLGEVSLSEADYGEQVSDLRVRHKTVGALHENDVNYLELFPSGVGFGRGQSTAGADPSGLVAYDTFLQTEGNLSGKALPVGGEWAGAGDAADWTVVAAEDVARRTVVSDANVSTGRYGLAGTSKHGAVAISALVKTGAHPTEPAGSDLLHLGVFGRYVDTNNWIKAVAVLKINGLIFSGSKLGVYYFKVYKRVGGTVTTLAEVQTPYEAIKMEMDISLFIGADGSWVADASAITTGVTNFSGPLATLSGQDDVLRTGETLGEGRVGIYDAWTPATALSRYCSQFSALGAETPPAVCNSGRSCRLTADGFSRYDSTGAIQGKPSLYRGMDMLLHPSDGVNDYNRLVVAMRRNDIDNEPDNNVTDKQQIEVLAEERILAPR